MKAVVIKDFGGPENLSIEEVPQPVPGENEVLVRVKATALNRADLLQRQGKYPPPKGASEILGLEIAGIIEKANESNFNIGDKVFGLIPGGGYAEYAVIHKDMAIPIPESFSFYEAAGIPEAFLTAYQALIWLGGLAKNETVLIHAGASGVGTAAIQLARLSGARVLVTASAGKHKICKDLGAKQAIDYKEGPFVDKVLALTANKGVDVILDFIGADYFHQNIDCLKTDGRLILLATMSGGKISDFDLRKILIKRIQIKGSTLRSRSLDYQVKLTNDFYRFAEPHIKEKKLKPVIDQIFGWNKVAEAHQYMEANRNTGKIILKVE